MTKQFISFALALILVGSISDVSAQSKKEKKSRYYQNSEPEPEFDVKGFFTDKEKSEVDKKTTEEVYDVKVSSKEDDSKYYDEKRVRSKEEREKAREENMAEREEVRRERRAAKEKEGYYTTFGTYKPYNENREKYDKYYEGGSRQTTAPRTESQRPAPAPMAKKRTPNEVEIKMTDNEHEYKTTVVKRRYTNLDVLCDDLDLAKIQRPVFKGICSECASDVDLIITNKNMSSLEKNYQLKTYYMMRDKRLREILDDDQYKKFLRIKDADEYLILTRDPELKDGINN